MKRRNIQWLAVAALVIFAVIFSLGLKVASARQTSHSGRDAATSPAAKVTRENGQVVIHLSQEAQKNLGLAEVPLKSARKRRQATIPAVVLSVANLQTLVSTYDTAAAQLQKAKITASVSRREYQRLKKLYGEQQNVSAKALQAAAGVHSSDEVDVRLAQENLSLAAGAVRQSWGDAIAGWLADHTNRIGSVLRRDDVLIEITLPQGETYSAPPSVEFSLPAGQRAFARFVSEFPQVDPRVQGVGYLYITQSRPGLAPGLNLIARFGVGTLHSGVIIPASAVVWLHGQAWTYVVTRPGVFARRLVPTDVPASGGWFVSQGFTSGESVVTRDAQQLLGVEIMPASSSHSAPAEGDDD